MQNNNIPLGYSRSTSHNNKHVSSVDYFYIIRNLLIWTAHFGTTKYLVSSHLITQRKYVIGETTLWPRSKTLWIDKNTTGRHSSLTQIIQYIYQVPPFFLCNLKNIGHKPDGPEGPLVREVHCLWKEFHRLHRVCVAFKQCTVGGGGVFDPPADFVRLPTDKEMNSLSF